MSDLPETMFRTTDFWVDAPDDFVHASSQPWDEVQVTVVMPAWVRPDGVCPAFQWIGQPFSSCDRCGRPYWEHTHEEFLIDHQSDPFGGRLRHEFITKKRRDRVINNWGGGAA